MDSNYDNESTNESVLLDHQTSDLNLIFDNEYLLAYPMSEEGFCSMWAGCRANYGVESGKVAFEVNLEDYCECSDLPKDDSEPYSIRIGWSIAQSSLQLGETPFSFAFSNNGKKCHDKTFEDYGVTFEKGNSVAAYIDFESDPQNIQLSFSKNGTDLGIAFIINKRDFKKKCENEFQISKSDDIASKFLFFPHVLSKNIVFEMNFGQRVSLIGDEPFAPIKNDFFLIQKIPIEKRFCLETQSNPTSEVLILVGLPHVGKTNWALNYAKKNPKKAYYIIGVSTILDKMKITVKKQKGNEATKQTEKNESESATLVDISNTDFTSENPSAQTALAKSLIEQLDKVLKCMNVLIEIASQSNRNIILDQPNVYESTRRRKMKLFENWERRAVVLIPTNQIYIERIAAAEKNGKEICTSLIDDMKANFTLPKICQYIDEIEFIELNQEEALKVIEIYNKEGLLNRHNSVVNRRLKTKQAIMKLHAGKLGSINAAMTRPGYRMNTPYNPFQQGAPYSADTKFNRFTSPNQMSNQRRGFSNPPYRMNRFPNGAPNPFGARPQMFGVAQSFGAPTYGGNQQWPAATSTELWTHQQQMSHYQAIPPSNQNIWAPALPITNNSMLNMIPNWMPPNPDSTNDKK